MAVSIRPATHADQPGICTVHLRAIRDTCSRSYASEQIDAWAGLLSPDSYTAVVEKQIMIVATDGPTVVGFGQLDPDAGEVEAVYVLPERQREGVGQTLLSELEAQARVRGISRLELSATLNATKFYERAGYARGNATVHRLPTGVELQCIRMGKELRGAWGSPTKA